MKNRINKLRSIINNKELDVFIVDSGENCFYLTGFTGTSARLVFTPEENYFITDFRYTEQAEEQIDGYKIIEANKKREEKVCELISRENIKKVGFESEAVSYKLYEKYSKNLNNIELIPCEKVVEQLRIIKEENEINKIKKAVKIADKAFNHILDYLEPGITEKEISLELEYFMKKAGGTKNSFDFIVASGKRSSMPHGVASEKEIEIGDLVTMDFGTVYQNYCSDITRTVILGEPTPKQSEIYQIVLNAQTEVIDRIKPGMTGREVDAIARDIIEQEGYKDRFKHGVGHGLGIEVHEAPRVSYKNEDKIEKGMVLTNEPGIYIPGWGGVRIEDDLYITENGCEVLNQAPKEFIQI